MNKTCFNHDAAYSDSKDLTKRTATGKIFRDKAYEIGNNPKQNGYERRLVYKFFDKKSKGGDIKSAPQNEQLARELYKPIIKKKLKEEKCIQHSKTIFGVLI